MKFMVMLVAVVGLLASAPPDRGVVQIARGSGPMLTNKASFDGRRLLLAGWDLPVATLWDVETGRQIREFAGHTEGVRSVALSPDGSQVLTGAGSTASVLQSTDNSVRLWDADSGKELRRFDGMSYPAWSTPVWQVGFSEDGRQVAGRGGDRGLAIWDVATGRLMFQEPTGDSRSPHGFLRGTRAMTFVPSRSVSVWDYRSGERLSAINVAHVWSSGLSPDGSLVVTTSGQEIALWSSSTGLRVRTYSGHKGLALDAAFSPDGRRLFSASGDGSVRVWESSSDQLLHELPHEGAVDRVLVSSDGTRVLTQWTGRVVGVSTQFSSLWDVTGNRELVRLDQSQVMVGFSPDGGTIPVVEGRSFGTRCCVLDSLLDAETGRVIRRYRP